MTTNQEGRQIAIRDSTSTVAGVAADWHALFDGASITAGPFNQRLLAWINDQLGTSYSNLLGAMAAYAANAGYNAWSSMSTLVLGGASSLLSGETDGLAFDFTDQSAQIKDTSTPANAYSSTGKVSSGALVGPGGKLTYTSPSNKLVRQADGYYKYGAHNLYLNSAAPANQSITVVSGASYAVTITGTVSVTASGAATGTWTAGTNTFTAATTTLTLGSTSGSGTVHVYRTPAVTDYVATAGSPVYALPYSYAADGSCEGLLVEEQRTNLLTYSVALNNATGGWTEQQTTPVLNYATAPNGLTQATRLIDNAATGTNVVDVNKAVNVTTTTTYTASIYAKADQLSWLAIAARFFTTPADGYTYFNLSTGTVGTTATGHTARISDAGNGWYRCSITFTTDASDTAGIIYFYVADGDGDHTVDLDGTSSVLIWGAQFEAGSFPTSPIITYGATATRAADNISIATSAFPYSATAGSVYEHFTPNQISSFTYLCELTDGTFNERVALGTVASTGVLNASVTDGAAGQVNGSTANAVAAGTASRAAIGYELNNVSYCLDGGTIVNDGVATMPTCTSLIVGNRHTGAGATSTLIKAISYVPRRKSDAELQAETT